MLPNPILIVLPTRPVLGPPALAIKQVNGSDSEGRNEGSGGGGGGGGGDIACAGHTPTKLPYARRVPGSATAVAATAMSWRSGHHGLMVGARGGEGS